ncbi:MAG: hypothetical protein LGB54_02565 [Sulfurovum sp.]|nr:hypothetical protein [Sulfurovum sp.]
MWKRYQNELIVSVAFVFALSMFIYKLSHHAIKAEASQKVAKEFISLQETVSLKKIWVDKRIDNRLKRIQGMLPRNKVLWSQKGKRLIATFNTLTGKEVNRVMTKLLNIAVQLESLNITKNGEYYKMEIRCKW